MYVFFVLLFWASIFNLLENEGSWRIMRTYVTVNPHPTACRDSTRHIKMTRRPTTTTATGLRHAGKQAGHSTSWPTGTSDCKQNSILLFINSHSDSIIAVRCGEEGRSLLVVLCIMFQCGAMRQNKITRWPGQLTRQDNINTGAKTQCEAVARTYRYAQSFTNFLYTNWLINPL